MARSIMVPANWAARIPGQSGAFYVSFPDAKTASEAARSLASELTDYGVPAAAVQGWSGMAGSRPGASTVGGIQRAARAANLEKSEGVDVLSGVKSWFGDVTGLGQRKGEIKNGVFKPFSAKDSPGIDWGAGRGEESFETGVSQYQNNSRFANKPVDPETLKRLRAIGAKATSGRSNQFLTDAQKAQRVKKFDPNSLTGKTTSIGGSGAKTFTPATNSFDPNLLRDVFPQGEGGMEGTGLDLNPEQKYLFDSFDPVGGIGNPAGTGTAPDLDLGESVDVNQIISLFTPGGRFGDAVTAVDGLETLNPLLEALLDTADLQNERVSLEQVADLEARSREQVAIFNKDAAIEIARQNGLSDTEVARITSDADTAIATARGEVEKYIAEQQLTGTEAQASATEAAAESARLGQEAAAESAAGATTAAAESMASGQLGAAEAAAGAASPFGFMNQGGTEANLSSIYEQINQVGLADAKAKEEIARIQSSVGLDQNQKEYLIAQINSEAQRAIAQTQAGGQLSAAQAAAGGQVGAAQAGASGFGALLSGNPAVNQQANEILRAQAANNAYGSAQLGQDQSRIDQILRGGLSAEQRLAEINASQSGQNFANQLNFMSNPSAVGFATEQGLFGGGNNQILQDINNSPEGNVPGSLFGFNSPSAGGAGGNQTTNTGNFNANTLRNASDEQIGFLQGAASAGGQTPSEFNQEVQSFTPQGY